MPFSNPILAGATLVRVKIQSEDYVPGVRGWAIFRDGSAEFNNIVARGDIIGTEFATAATGRRIIMGNSVHDPDFVGLPAIVWPVGDDITNRPFISGGDDDQGDADLLRLGIPHADGGKVLLEFHQDRRVAALFAIEEDGSRGEVDVSPLGVELIAQGPNGVPTGMVVVRQSGVEILGVRQKVFAMMDVDQPFAATALASVTDLILDLAENATYEISGFWSYTGQTFAAGPGDIKHDWTIPVGATMQWARNGAISNVVGNIDTVVTNHSTIRALGTFGVGTNVSASPRGWIRTGAHGLDGGLQLRAAQNSATAQASIMRSGSWIKAVRVA